MVMYFLVKVISRMFLQSKSKNRRSSGARMFYQTFKNMAEQQKRQQRQQQSQQQQGQPKSNGAAQFDEVEEAEYEDITEDVKSSKTSD